MGNKGTSFKVDHALDDEMEIKSRSDDSSSIATISISQDDPLSEDSYLALLETPEEKKKRIRSHYVVYTTMMIMTIGFSIVISGTWPYLVELAGGEDNIDKTALGWVIAANPFGQMIASPIVGYVGNRMGKIRGVCYFTVTCFVLGNILYGLLPYCTDFWENSYYHLMILSRFVVGLSSANVSLCRSYVASSTVLKERTKGISMISAAQSLGFVIGPAIQMVLSLAIEDDMKKYSSTGYVTAILGLINFVLLTPFIFHEFNIAEKEKKLLKKLSPEKEEIVLPKPDYVALFSILLAFFFVQFIYVLLETLMEPFMEDQYGLCADIAVVLVGIIFIFAGVFGIAMFILAAKLSKIFDERKLLMFAGFLPICIGTFLFFPWGPEELTYCEDFSTSTSMTSTMIPFYATSTVYDPGMAMLNRVDELHSQILNRVRRSKEDFYDEDTPMSRSFQDRVDETCADEKCLGCPSEQDWCDGYPKLNVVQFILGYLFIFVGYPFGLTLANTIFSKILGPRPQGTWMGILTASGSLSRIIGPIFVTYLYTNQGTRITFTIILGLMIIGFLDIAVNYKRLVPMKVIKDGDEDKY